MTTKPFSERNGVARPAVVATWFIRLENSQLYAAAPSTLGVMSTYKVNMLTDEPSSHNSQWYLGRVGLFATP